MEELSFGLIACSSSQLACGVMDAKYELGSVHSVEELGSVHCTVQATGRKIVSRESSLGSLCCIKTRQYQASTLVLLNYITVISGLSRSFTLNIDSLNIDSNCP